MNRRILDVTRRAFFVLMMVLTAWALALAAVPQASADTADTQDDQGGLLTAHYLNVGQGDSEFVVFPDGKTMLIDAGESWAGDAVVDYIQNTLGYDRIDYLVATHPHSDHIGGMKAVLWSPIFIDQVFAPEVANDTETFYGFLDAVQAVGKQITSATAGLVLDEADGLRVEVLSPSVDASYEDLNDWSAVVRVTWGSTSFLFTGDASYQVIDSLNVGHVDVLKVGHHGSDTSTSIPTLEALSPSVAVIEVGWGNDYGHPTQETLDELSYCGAQVWRTDADGNVIVQSDGTAVWAYSADTWATEPVSAEQIEQRRVAEEQARAEEAARAQAEADAAAQEAAQAQAQAEVAQSQNIGDVVYITKTGEKYHRAGCSSLRKSCIEISRSDAIARGYEPCKKCNP